MGESGRIIKFELEIKNVQLTWITHQLANEIAARMCDRDILHSCNVYACVVCMCLGMLFKLYRTHDFQLLFCGGSQIYILHDRT